MKLHSTGSACPPMSEGRPKGRKKESVTLTYWWWLQQLDAFKAEFGHADVPREYRTADDAPLGSWLHRQRVAKRAGSLSDEMASALQQRGITWNRRETQADSWLEACRAYAQEHGTLAVPARFVTEDGTKLGAWLAQRRHDYVQERLNPSTRDALREIDPQWMKPSWEEAANVSEATVERREKQDQFLVEAAEYARTHGNLHVPARYRTDSGLALGEYMRRCRQRRAGGRLDAPTARVLDRLDPAWFSLPDLPQQRTQALLAQARQFHLENNHLRVPVAYVSEDGLPLGKWLLQQRVLRRRDEVEEPTASVLAELDPGWAERQLRQPMTVPAGLTALREFKQEHGHADPPSDFVNDEGFLLGVWLGRQRNAYRMGELDSDTREQLDLLGVTWHPKRRKRKLPPEEAVEEAAPPKRKPGRVRKGRSQPG